MKRPIIDDSKKRGIDPEGTRASQQEAARPVRNLRQRTGEAAAGVAQPGSGRADAPSGAEQQRARHVATGLGAFAARPNVNPVSAGVANPAGAARQAQRAQPTGLAAMFEAHQPRPRLRTPAAPAAAAAPVAAPLNPRDSEAAAALLSLRVPATPAVAVTNPPAQAAPAQAATLGAAKSDDASRNMLEDSSHAETLSEVSRTSRDQPAAEAAKGAAMPAAMPAEITVPDNRKAPPLLASAVAVTNPPVQVAPAQAATLGEAKRDDASVNMLDDQSRADDKSEASRGSHGSLEYVDQATHDAIAAEPDHRKAPPQAAPAAVAAPAVAAPAPAARPKFELPVATTKPPTREYIQNARDYVVDFRNKHGKDALPKQLQDGLDWGRAINSYLIRAKRGYVDLPAAPRVAPTADRPAPAVAGVAAAVPPATVARPPARLKRGDDTISTAETIRTEHGRGAATPQSDSATPNVPAEIIIDAAAIDTAALDAAALGAAALGAAAPARPRAGSIDTIPQEGFDQAQGADQRSINGWFETLEGAYGNSPDDAHGVSALDMLDAGQSQARGVQALGAQTNQAPAAAGVQAPGAQEPALAQQQPPAAAGSPEFNYPKPKQWPLVGHPEGNDYGNKFGTTFRFYIKEYEKKHGHDALPPELQGQHNRNRTIQAFMQSREPELVAQLIAQATARVAQAVAAPAVAGIAPAAAAPAAAGIAPGEAAAMAQGAEQTRRALRLEQSASDAQNVLRALGISDSQVERNVAGLGQAVPVQAPQALPAQALPAQAQQGLESQGQESQAQQNQVQESQGGASLRTLEPAQLYDTQLDGYGEDVRSRSPSPGFGL